MRTLKPSYSLLSMFIQFMILSLNFDTASAAPRCSKITSVGYGADWTLSIPKELAKSVARIKTNPSIAAELLKSMGFDSGIAKRMVKNEEWVLPFLLENKTFVRPNGSVTDTTRYKRRWLLKTMRVAGGHEPITVYRGVALRDAGQKIDLSAEKFFENEFDSVGNVAWVTPIDTEAEHYAKFGAENSEGVTGYILKFQIPAELFFQGDEFSEGFLHPKMISDFKSYLLGAYEVRVGKTQYREAHFGFDDLGGWEAIPGKVRRTWIPFERLPQKSFE